jgi:WD40 repeat protein
MNQPATGEPHKTKVFISYSRVDGTFAEKLRAALMQLGFEAYLDKQDILPGESWRTRIEGLILAADAVVFIISPSSIASEICSWEIRRALELKKSLTPLHWCVVPNDAVPEGLSARNYVFFDAYERSGMADEAAFEESLAKLETAIKVTDFLWVREHTKWVARAVDWDQSKPARPEGKLLRSADIAAVQAWTHLKPAGAPDIPPVLSDYLAESIGKEERDSKRLKRVVGRAFIRPVEEALSAGHPERALRLVASAAILADDIHLRLIPELLPCARRATFGNRALAVLRGHQFAVTIAKFQFDSRRIVTASHDATARVWEAETAQLICILKGHDAAVVDAQFSPDGRRVVTASRDNTARVWDAQTGEQISLLAGHEHVSADRKGVRCAVFNPDGRLILTAAADKTARIWNAADGKQLAVLHDHSGPMTSASFSPNGALVVTPAGSIRLCDLSTFPEVAHLSGHERRGIRAAFSPDGLQILTMDSECARIWDVTTRQEIAVFRGHSDGKANARVNSSFSPDGRFVVSACDDQSACVWSAQSGEPTAILKGHADNILAVSFSPDGRRVVTASKDKTVRLWDATTGMQIDVLRGHDGPVHSAFFSSDGCCILTGSQDSSARIFSSETGLEIRRFVGHERLGASFSPDGKWILTASTDGTARLWDAESAECVFALRGYRPDKEPRDRAVYSRAIFSPNGRFFATASTDNPVRLWDVEGHLIATLTQASAHSASVSFSADNNRIVATEGNVAIVWDIHAARSIAILTGHEKEILRSAFSPDGRRILTSSYDKSVRIWDAQNGQLLHLLSGHRDWVTIAAFTPDGRRIVTGSTDRTARMWDVETGLQVAALKCSAIVRDLSFSPDGRRFATACADYLTRVWDLETGEIILTLRGHTKSAEGCAYSPDGGRIATSSIDNTARIWDAEEGMEIVRLDGAGAAFSPDGRRLLTIGTDGCPRIWDLSRTEAINYGGAFALVAALAQGVGMRTGSERTDLLMQEAPDDLFAEAKRLLGDDTDLVDQITEVLRMRLHPKPK